MDQLLDHEGAYTADAIYDMAESIVLIFKNSKKTIIRMK
jgi:hypothetical protein